MLHHSAPVKSPLCGEAGATCLLDNLAVGMVVIPEPAAWVLLLGGACVLAVWNRRSRPSR